MSHQCSYCNNKVSVFEALMEYGKYYHEDCFIHMTNKEIAGYRKKFINRKLTEGDKFDLADKYNLVQNLKTEKTKFHGFLPTKEYEYNSPKMNEKTFLAGPNGLPAIGKDGTQIIIEKEVSSVSVRFQQSRPKVVRTISPEKPKHLTANDILQLGPGKKVIKK